MPMVRALLMECKAQYSAILFFKYDGLVSDDELINNLFCRRVMSRSVVISIHRMRFPLFVVLKYGHNM